MVRLVSLLSLSEAGALEAGGGWAGADCQALTGCARHSAIPKTTGETLEERDCISVEGPSLDYSGSYETCALALHPARSATGKQGFYFFYREAIKIARNGVLQAGSRHGELQRFLRNG